MLCLLQRKRFYHLLVIEEDKFNQPYKRQNPSKNNLS